jgi:hypothetical protein
VAAPTSETVGELEFVAFHEGARPPVAIVPGERWRSWMNATVDRYANRCLPLLMANQAGWVLLNPAPFTATWDGGDSHASLEIEYADDTPEDRRIAKSHFGYGILTFGFPYTICTPRGYNTLARGPANWPKDGICALDGLVETDWSATPFTMNWKLTRPGSVEFAADEPFCQILPQARGELERFSPRMQSLDEAPELGSRVRAWEASRTMIDLGKALARRSGDPKWRRFWLSDYFKGHAPTGESSPEHQTTLRLGPFD